MSNLKLTSIQTGLRVSLARFMKIREIVWKKAEEACLGKKILGTNQKRKKLNILAEKIKLRVQKYIKSNDIMWTQEALLRLIHIEKGNVACRKLAKKNDDRRWLTPLRKQKSNTKIGALRQSPATSAKPVKTIVGRKRRSPEKDAAGIKFINTRN